MRNSRRSRRNTAQIQPLRAAHHLAELPDHLEEAGEDAGGLKGLKIRVLGGPPTEMAKALGAVPALLPMPDMYQALDKGVFDGAAVPWEAIQVSGSTRSRRTCTMVPFYASYFSLCANRQKIQSLPKDVRDQIMSVSGAAKARSSGARTSSTAPSSRRRWSGPRPASIELNRYDVAGRGGRPLEQGRRRAALGRVGEEDGGQGPQGGPRHPQLGARACQELNQAHSDRELAPGIRASMDCAVPAPSRAGMPIRIQRAITYDGVFGKLLYRCELALLYVGVFATFAMMCLTSADALSRYAFNRPILGALRDHRKIPDGGGDLPRPVLCAIAAALFIRVTFLVDRLSGRRGSRPTTSPSWSRWRSACVCCGRPPSRRCARCTTTPSSARCRSWSVRPIASCRSASSR